MTDTHPSTPTPTTCADSYTCPPPSLPPSTPSQPTSCITSHTCQSKVLPPTGVRDSIGSVVLIAVILVMAGTLLLVRWRLRVGRSDANGLP